MIRISDWLLRQKSELPADKSFEMWADINQLDSGGGDAMSEVDHIQLAHDEGYRKGVTDAQREADERLAQETEVLKTSHKQALSAMETLCSQFIADQIEDGLKSWKAELASSLVGVLDPFLDELAREQATSKLLELVEHEIIRSGSALLEIRAPAALHEQLGDMLSSHELSAAIVDGDSVVVSCRAERIVFESLAKRWIEYLRAGDT